MIFELNAKHEALLGKGIFHYIEEDQLKLTPILYFSQ